MIHSATGMIQSVKDIEHWYATEDPWDYEHTLDDVKRRDILLSELPKRTYKRVLDVGCGHGFITRELPGKHIVGVDVSKSAIKQARKLGQPRHANTTIEYQVVDLFSLHNTFKPHSFDLILITGVLYPQYIGKANTLVYYIISRLLAPGGIVVTVHISDWYSARFPLLKLKEFYYPYRNFSHILEVYHS